MRMKRRLVLTVACAIALAGGALAWFRFAPRAAPPEQPPLMTIAPSNVDALKAEFNGAQRKTRIVALWSPT